VRTGVVIARTSASGAQQLIAYVVREELEVALSSRTLHTYLQGKLPDYMIPSHFVALEALPLNANGKVDRRALPLPDQAALEPEVSFVAPRTPAEEVVAKIWVDILGVQQVGLFDDFFAIGGHSLLATQVISRLNSAFQIELPLRSLFEARTVDALICEIVRIHGEREIIEEIAQVLKEIECLTEDEVEQQLSS
jgi:surfactin family lipopeptide synthetase A